MFDRLPRDPNGISIDPHSRERERERERYIYIEREQMPPRQPEGPILIHTTVIVSNIGIDLISISYLHKSTEDDEDDKKMLAFVASRRIQYNNFTEQLSQIAGTA